MASRPALLYDVSRFLAKHKPITESHPRKPFNYHQVISALPELPPPASTIHFRLKPPINAMGTFYASGGSKVLAVGGFEYKNPAGFAIPEDSTKPYSFIMLAPNLVVFNVPVVQFSVSVFPEVFEIISNQLQNLEKTLVRSNIMLTDAAIDKLTRRIMDTVTTPLAPGLHCFADQPQDS